MRRCTRIIGVAVTLALYACGKAGSGVEDEALMNASAHIATGTGVATLSWVPPKQNQDGSPLQDLAGYYIYYGKDPANLYGVIRISDPAAVAHTVDHLAAGTYYFKVVPFTANGVKGSASSLVSKTIP
jgi:hypothetical protein